MRVVIVGAGVFGSALAWWLAREGEEVVLIDQFEPGDPRATSGGETRLIRCSHGSDPDYSAMAWRALELWPEVAPGLLERCGMSWFAHREDGWEAESERTLTELGIPVAREPHPLANSDDLAFTLLEPEAGVLRAQKATEALAAGAVEAGAKLVHGRATPGGDGVAEVAARTEGTVPLVRFEGDAVVWACGGWLAGLFGELVTLRVTTQNLFFYAGAWAGPAWVDYDRAMYGTGPIDGLGAKVAPDHEGPACDPDADLPECTPDNERLARAYLEHRFPSYAGAPLRSSRACRYELSPDSHFLAGPHPEQPRTWLYGGGSGHGFKHGPALAERMAGALRGTGELPAVWAVGARSPGRSLRTAGSG